jgi:hypothetical protein
MEAPVPLIVLTHALQRATEASNPARAHAVAQDLEIARLGNLADDAMQRAQEQAREILRLKNHLGRVGAEMRAEFAAAKNKVATDGQANEERADALKAAEDVQRKERSKFAAEFASMAVRISTEMLAEDGASSHKKFQPGHGCIQFPGA